MSEPDPDGMSERMSNGPDYLTLYEKLGDMQATLRVVKHDTATNSGKLDALANLVMQQGHLAEDVKELTMKVATLEIEKHQRDGAIGLIEWITKHWPFLIAILTTIFISLWGNDKL